LQVPFIEDNMSKAAGNKLFSITSIFHCTNGNCPMTQHQKWE